MRINNHTFKARLKKHPFWIGLGVAIFLIIINSTAFFAWYIIQLSPFNEAEQQPKLVTIEVGSSPSNIATMLEEKNLIRNSFAFTLYVKTHGYANALQAGTYKISPAESLSEIVKHFVNGTVDTFTITFLPGATLKENRDVLIKAGYRPADVDKALSQTYRSPLFNDKPANASLEGYIYGDTYTFSTGATVQSILERTFNEFEANLTDNNLYAAFKGNGLTLYEAITLASIVQREASAKGDDMPQIAQVFYNRLSRGMPLGSDVTYQYAADIMGVDRDPQLDSPYNTRRYQGLPPGPIATPGLSALRAVGMPAKGDYLYFLSGDDDITYFARTLQEHEQNIRIHCEKKCKIV